MKKLYQCLSLVSFAFILSTTSTTAISAQPLPYVGLDVGARYIPFRQHFGHNLFKKTYAQGNIFAGIKFTPFLGMEFGFEQTQSKSSLRANTSGTRELGVVLRPVNNQNLIAFSINNFRIHGPHLSVTGFYPFCFCDNLTLMGAVGLANLRAHATKKTVFIDLIGPLTDDEILELKANFRKRKIIPRASLHLIHMMTKNAGIRLGVTWEDTSRFGRMRSTRNTFTQGYQAGLKDSLFFALGLFWQF